MKNMMRKVTIYAVLLMIQFSMLQATTADELMQVHKVTIVEMNAISTPQAGSLVYNTDDQTVFFYTGTIWKRLRSYGSETIVNAGNGMVVTGSGTNISAYVIGL